jgi:pyruvate/2-oxoglutarate dehydrogenase complex dihydrolipoamide acyltransferase (E2) component
MLGGHDAKLVRWYKDDGDFVSAGDPICEIETDNAAMEIESFATGILRRRAKIGDTIRTGDDLCEIEPISN